MAKGSVRFELNRAGVRELLQSGEMSAIVTSLGNSVLSRLGTGYEISTYVGANRVNCRVAAVTNEARKENLESNTLLKALGG